MKNLYDAIINFKQDSHHRIINVIEITEARGDDDVSRCLLP
jgi:hypothetical protein